MVKRFRSVVFRFYEQTLVRNWFYTLAFGTFVPVGCRFAYVAWRRGAWFDKPLAIIAGTIIGMTSVVTLLRVWEVPPQRTSGITEGQKAPITVTPPAFDLLSESKRQSALNRQIAKEAKALGSARR
jgi:hypothetical protein